MPTIEVTENEKMILYGLRAMFAENSKKQLEKVEELYFAKSKQTLFTKKELAEKWGCTVVTVGTYLNVSGVEPVDKSGKKFLFDLNQAEEAKRDYTKRTLVKHKLETRARVM